jgi:hypothetical protein
MSTEAIAVFRPVWAALITSWVPAESAGLQTAQERGPERPVLAVADIEAEDLTPAVGGDTRAITTAWDTTRLLTRALQKVASRKTWG